MSTKAQRETAHKLRFFAHAKQSGNVSFTCRYFGVSRDTFYRWKKNYCSDQLIQQSPISFFS